MWRPKAFIICGGQKLCSAIMDMGPGPRTKAQGAAGPGPGGPQLLGPWALVTGPCGWGLDEPGGQFLQLFNDVSVYFYIGNGLTEKSTFLYFM